VGGHRLGVFERAAGLKIGGDAGSPKYMAAELLFEAGLGGAAADRAVGVDAVHRLTGEFARLATRGAEEGTLAVIADPGRGEIRGNFYEGIKLTPNQRTIIDMLLMVNGICTKENLYAALYGSKQYKPDAAIIRETLRVIRKQLRPHGIDIKNVRGKGYNIPSKSKIKLRELIIR
jgi:hypothetical protein